MRRRAVRIPVVALVATLACLAGLVGGAFAAFTASVQAQQAIGTMTIGTSASATGTVATTTANACTRVNLTWTAATNADAYRIEVREGAGAWTTAATVGAVTTWADTATRTNAVVAYRVFPRDASSGWEAVAPTQAPDVTCGVRPVTDLVVANPCSSSTLTWTAPGGGVTTYDVQRRVNNGAWTAVATDQATVGHTDATVHPLAAVVEYQVRPGIGAGTNGDWSTIATVASWDAFRVRSITFANSAAGTANTLNAGDTVTVAFSKPLATASIATHTVRTVGNGNNSGLYLGTAANDVTGIGRSAFVAFGTNGNWAGTGSWADANATYVWTSTVAGTTMTAALANEAFTVGTGPKCAGDGSGLVAVGTTTSAGRW